MFQNYKRSKVLKITEDSSGPMFTDSIVNVSFTLRRTVYIQCLRKEPFTGLTKSFTSMHSLPTLLLFIVTVG